jgi:hypothetical protein
VAPPRPGRAHRSRRLDQHPRRPGAGDTPLDGGHDSVRIGQVGWQGEGGAAGAADAGGHAVEAGPAAGEQRHLSTQLRQPHGRGRTKPAAGPGDDRQLAFRVWHLILPP